MLVTLDPASVSMATCWHHQGHLRSASWTAAVRTLTHARTPNAATHPCPQAPPTALPHPWGTAFSRAQRCAVFPCPEPLSPLQEKKKRPRLRPRRGQSRDMPIPCSLKELLEYGPDSVMKTATISWLPSKLPPLTASLLISGCAKCLACSFSFSSCSSPLRKVQDYSCSQCSDGKVEAQRGRVTRPRLQLLNGRASTNSDLLDSRACSPMALGTSRKTPQHREALINSY